MDPMYAYAFPCWFAIFSWLEKQFVTNSKCICIVSENVFDPQPFDTEYNIQNIRHTQQLKQNS